MPRPRPRPRPTPRPNPITDIGSEIEKKLEDDLKKRLNVTTLPSEIKTIVKKTAAEVAGTVTKQDIAKKAMTYGKGIFREADPKQAISMRLSEALKGVRVVSQSSDLQKMLDENAKLLFLKKTALVNAGFNDTDAFQLILAEVSAKKSR